MITVTNNPLLRLLLVEDQEAQRVRYVCEDDNGLPQLAPIAAWMLFSYGSALEVERACSVIMYNEVITGERSVSHRWVNAAWEAARSALEDPSAVRLGTATPPPSRITQSIAAYLAMKDRIDLWGGFTGERDNLPSLLERLSAEERSAVDERLRGLVVV